MVDRIPMRDAAGVLEVAAGACYLLPHIAASAPDAVVIGLDVTEEMLRLAPEPLPRVVGDVIQLPFGDSAFDVVVMAFALFHVLDPTVALDEIARVLRRGGRLAISTWERGDDDLVAQRIWTEELDSRGAAPAKERPGSHEQVDTEEKMLRLLTKAGFTDIASTRRPIVEEMTPDTFLDRCTELGRDAERFVSLGMEQRADLLERMTVRLGGLTASDLTSREVALFFWCNKSGSRSAT
jgi:SAM-dependent methyltransferase